MHWRSWKLAWNLTYKRHYQRFDWLFRKFEYKVYDFFDNDILRHIQHHSITCITQHIHVPCVRSVFLLKHHDAGNGLKDPTAPISTLRRPGHPYPHNRIQWEYSGLRDENRGPFKGQQASASNSVMYQVALYFDEINYHENCQKVCTRKTISEIR